VCLSLAHLLVLLVSQDVKFEFLVKSRVDKVKAAVTYSMKSENKLDGASNFRTWKIRIDLIFPRIKWWISQLCAKLLTHNKSVVKTFYDKNQNGYSKVQNDGLLIHDKLS
jgi:hypothetical protein